VSKCDLASVGGCQGPIHVHHVDADPTNNAPRNRKPLCQSHHFLVENGRIDLDDPEMPEFIISSGKRRYFYAYPRKSAPWA
jgi:hypothetical protein